MRRLRVWVFLWEILLELSPRTAYMRSIRSEQGSSVLEFVILVPLFLVIMLGGFTQIHQTQMRQLAVTSLARELSRAIELGQSPRHLNDTLANLRIDLGLSESPTLKLEAMSVDTAWLRVHYKGQLFQTQLSLEGADPGWKRALRSDLGSMLPLSLGFFALLALIFGLVANYGFAQVADFRANQLAAQWAIAAARQPNPVDEFALDLHPSLDDSLRWKVSRTDAKTTEIVVCYGYRPIFDFWQKGEARACAKRAARLISR
jgi:Flp pilus assembly protein TadG